jgi:hypothetical protein
MDSQKIQFKKQTIMKRTLISMIFILMTSAELYSANDTNRQEDSKSLSELIKTTQNDDSLLYSDTTFIHDVKEIDGHVVVQDTIIIENILEREVLKFIQDDSHKSIEKVMVILIFTFVIGALIYRKKKNG